MMYGKRVKYCVTYKTAEKSFDIYKQKMLHNFRIPVLNENLEGADIIEIRKLNVFLVFKLDCIRIFDSFTLKQIGEQKINLLVSETREPNQIIGLRKSPNENWLAVITGKNLIRYEQKANQLYVFKI